MIFLEILSSMALFFFALSLSNQSSFLLKNLVALDSLASMLEYFSFHLLNQKIILLEKNPFRRYYYYLLLTWTSKIAEIATYQLITPYLRYLLPFFFFSPIRGYLLTSSSYRSIESQSYNWIHHQIRNLICLIFAYLLNFLCQETLDLSPEISQKEISHLLDQANRDSALNFIRIFVFTNIIESLAPTRGYLIPFLQRAFNQGKVLNQKPSCRYEDPFPHLEPQDKIRAVIQHRKFKQFYNPEIQLTLLRLYAQRDEVWNFTSWSRLSSIFLRFTSFYSLTYLLIDLPFQPLVFGAATLGYYFYTRKENNRGWIFRLIGSFFYYLTGSPLIGCAISELIDLLGDSIDPLLDWMKKEGDKIREAISYWEIGEITLTSLLVILFSSLPNKTLSSALLIISFLLFSLKASSKESPKELPDSDRLQKTIRDEEDKSSFPEKSGNSFGKHSPVNLINPLKTISPLVSRSLAAHNGALIGLGSLSNYDPRHLLSLGAMILLYRIGSRSRKEKGIKAPLLFESYHPSFSQEKSRSSGDLLDQMKGEIQSTTSFESEAIGIGDEVINLSSSTYHKVYQDGVCFRETYLDQSMYQRDSYRE